MSVSALVFKKEERQGAFRTLFQTKTDMEEMQKHISDALGISIAECAVDDITGRLHVLSTSAPIPADKANNQGVCRRGRRATK
jgi:hypothetical protein